MRQWTQKPLPTRPVRTFHGHTCAVACLAGDADLDVIVSGGAKGLFIIHRLSRGVILHVISHSNCNPSGPALFNHGMLSGMVLTKDGEAVWTLPDGSLRSVDVNGNTTGMAEQLPGGVLNAMTLSADGCVLFTAGKEGPIHICSARTLVFGGCFPSDAVGRNEEPLPFIIPALSFALSPCGGFLFAGLLDGSIDVFASSCAPGQVSIFSSGCMLFVISMQMTPIEQKQMFLKANNVG